MHCYVTEVTDKVKMTMNDDLKTTINRICGEYGNDRTRLMDVVLAVQKHHGNVCDDAMDAIAAALQIHRVEVASLVSFYSFLKDRPGGKIVIRLCNSIIDRMQGVDRVAEVFQQELGIKMGEVTADGAIALEWTSCIGMSDQAPAALINDVVVTRLSTDKARQIVADLKHHMDPRRLVKQLGDGNNAHDLVQAMVENNIRTRGTVVLAAMKPGEALANALGMSPTEVIRNVKNARLRGRGGAGFPTGLKWEFTRAGAAGKRYIVCNADEGEPGTFKDRVILTECPDTAFEGMTIGGYAIGAAEGIVYLRAEYAYLRAFLESVLAERRRLGLLGKNICGKKGFDFDIRIQMGAGAYICGEETALLSSCEGLRGDPKNRPPFPAQQGYLGCPTAVNNVETYCCAARILERGAGWFSGLGTQRSAGTKLLSISGDCKRPGIYEVSLGIKLQDVLKMAGAEDAIAVQVGGSSGQMIGPEQYGRLICFDDLATGGSMMVFGPGRDLLEVADAFMEFFVHESCGYCTPCRAGNVLLRQGLQKIRNEHGELSDLDYLMELGETIKLTSRCGLGQTSANPVLSSLANFRSLYEARLKPLADGRQAGFDLARAVGEASRIAGRKSVHLKD
jgi:[NiFe] hydrogenase diaphorase moiety large subunit